MPGMGFEQFRIFEVFEPIPSAGLERFLGRLAEQVQTNEKLLLVSGEEIIRGRAANGRPLGHPADYLIGERRIHPESAPIVRIPRRTG